MATTIITVVTVLAIVSIGLLALLWFAYIWDKEKYIQAVKLELFKIQCPYYNSDIVLQDYIEGIAPEKTARTLMAYWNKFRA